MPDLSHLHALQAGLAREQGRLAAARTGRERRHRAVWVAQCEREIADEYRFLGITPPLAVEAMADDALLAELFAN